MKRTLQILTVLLLVVTASLSQQIQSKPVAMAGIAPNGRPAYFRLDSLGALATSGAPGLMYVNQTTLSTFAPVGMDPFGHLQYFGLDQNGDLKVQASSAFNPRGTYSGATTYAKNDAVDYIGQTYISIQDSNLNNTPLSSPTWWMPLYAQGRNYTGVLCNVPIGGLSSGTGSYQTVASCTIPGELLSATGGVEIYCGVETAITDATMKIVFGSSGSAYVFSNVSNPVHPGETQIDGYIFNNSSLTSQWGRFTGDTAPIGGGVPLWLQHIFNISSVDTTADVAVSCQIQQQPGGQWTVGGFFVNRVAQ